ncbi:MAG: TIM barrel protein, partial [Armatimonadota bacterium]
GLAKLPEMAALGQALGCTRVPTWVRPVSDELTFEENFQLHARRLRACAEILRDNGCSLGLEFVAPKTSRIGAKYEFIHDLPGMLELCEAIGTGNVGLLLDCWHWYTAHGTVGQIKGLRPEQVVYIHVNDAPAGVEVDEQIDSVRCLPGATGVIDIAGFFQALTHIRATAPVTPEPFVKELREMPAEEAARTVGASMDKIWRQGGLA